jgi:aminoglycoside/choline kinase family phosphotransferase/choline kinase
MNARKAIVLAAGYGTRLRPFTRVTPKPLLPVWGEPMISRIVALLREHGVDEIVVNCHHLHEQVEAWCAANGCRAVYEPEILGTGGVLNPLREWIGSDDFFLVNGDIVLEGLDGEKWDEVWSDHDDKNAIATCLVTEDGPRTIEVEPEHGYVTNWKSDDAGCRGTWTYCGLALLKPEILKYVEPAGFSSIVSAYEKALSDGMFVRASATRGLLWTDAGTVQTYLDLNSDGGDNAYDSIPQVRAALDAVGDAGGVELMGFRGSARAFFRSGRGVIVVYDDARDENKLYAAHSRFLSGGGIPVPAILADMPDKLTEVMEWAGESRKMSIADYVAVVDLLARFNALGAEAERAKLEMQPPFSPETWRWERDLFERHCLGERYSMAMPPQVCRELEEVEKRLEGEPKALVHRDFQSSNILWRKGGDGADEPCVIDFQGMRIGPAAYDLASLLYDPYVEFSGEDRLRLSKLYGEKSGRGDIVDVLPFAAVQRLVQCLGAYGRLVSVGQGGFAKFFLPALRNLHSAAHEAGLDSVAALAGGLVSREEHAVSK